MSDVNPVASTANVHRPVSTSDLAEFVRVAAGGHNTIRIQAGRTHERFSNRGADTDLTLDMTGLNEVVEYSPYDLTLAVEPGMTLASIDQLLAEQGQRLVLDAPNRDRATIGGTFASGLSGPRRLRYGSLKDMVIGAEVVNSRGEIAKTGGMVVKNVSGYELARLHYGAHGAFGIVSRLNLKVLPAVESRVETQIHFEAAGEALEAGARVLVSALDPAAVYVTRDDAGGWKLHVQLEGAAAYTAVQAERAIDFVGGQSSDVAPVDGNSTPAFDAATDLTDEGAAVVRLSVPASQQSALLEQLDNGAYDEVLADMGSGLIYLRCRAGAFDVGRIRDLGVPTALLAVPEQVRAQVDVFGEMDANALALLRRLKKEYDPDRIFNPGSFVSNL